jgi:hypothetical protein
MLLGICWWDRMRHRWRSHWEFLMLLLLHDLRHGRDCSRIEKNLWVIGWFTLLLDVSTSTPNRGWKLHYWVPLRIYWQLWIIFSSWRLIAIHDLILFYRPKQLLSHLLIYSQLLLQSGIFVCTCQSSTATTASSTLIQWFLLLSRVLFEFSKRSHCLKMSTARSITFCIIATGSVVGIGEVISSLVLRGDPRDNKYLSIFDVILNLPELLDMTS